MLARRLSLFVFVAPFGLIFAQATSVPTEIQLPGTQPEQVGLEGVSKCDNCHAGYDPAVEPFQGWQGSMMSHAGRDPLFWATVAVAEQDFSGSGDLCIRCHSVEGWTDGRSTPTDGSDLRAQDAAGVSCDVCHQLTNPDDSEHLGAQSTPFLAHDGGNPPVGFYGGGMFVLNDGNEKLGPYSDSSSPHPGLQSFFHRSSEVCGTCHDVSNPAVGDLAHNNGAFAPLPAGTFSGVFGAPVEEKAAFKNFPYAYGVVERTFSEHRSSAFYDLRVSSYTTLPVELQSGAIRSAYEAARDAVPGGAHEGDYADGAPRYFSCQTCHMKPTQGVGCNKAGAPFRDDLPLHDLTGGNYWVPDAIVYLDASDDLVLGGGLSAAEVDALSEGRQRAIQNLNEAASLEVVGDSLRVVNLTGHKLISGYPEGRRMWLNVRWFDDLNTLLREDGAYGPLTVQLDGQPLQVETILEPHDAHTHIYEAHMGMTSEWAGQLITLGTDPALVLSFDRDTGAFEETLGGLAAATGTVAETFHFVLNNVVIADNRIPPYGMRYDDALERNCAPVPDSLYGDPGQGGTYQYFDELELDPPAGASRATIDLLYQPTSWEYVQFLYLANDQSVGFLASTGEDLLDAWVDTGMAAPEVMASTTWTQGGGKRVRKASPPTATVVVPANPR